VYTAMTVGAALVLLSMARRWRSGEPLDLPTPYDTDHDLDVPR
jgi:cytochrome bd ubiquinol oxidase subunit I